ncbi:MAG: putative addiction module antidote protein [Treponema sp.]|jgi:probable addiction module antidote protein|nr:putative addiction module antidote protein [Treponema sp.]
MLETKKFDVSGYLKTEKDIEEYLDVVLEEKDWQFLPVALADIAKARRAMGAAAKAAGVSRTSLYQSLSEEGRPSFGTVARVAAALGYRVTLAKKFV